MWLWGYNIAITSYTACLRIAALFHRKARLWVEGRSTLFERLETFTFEKTLWFHCASVGEFEQGLPLIRLLQQDYPESTLLLTFFSPSGYSYALEHYPEFQIS